MLFILSYLILLHKDKKTILFSYCKFKEDRNIIDSKDILTLLSIPSEDVSSSEIIKDNDNTIYVELELKDNRSTCAFCFSNNIGIKIIIMLK